MEGLKTSKLVTFAGATLGLALVTVGCTVQNAAQKAQAAAQQSASSAQAAEAAAAVDNAMQNQETENRQIQHQAGIFLPRYHRYQLFAKIDTERSGYGMYPYVLSGNVMVSGQSAIVDVQKRFDALLRAIMAHTDSIATLTGAAIPTKETNVFCIPAKAAGSSLGTRPSASGSPGPLSLQNYDSQLASIYRLRVERRLAGEAVHRNLDDHVGPFLVSTLTLLNQTRSGAPILFADLSNTHPDAMQEVVEVYKQRVEQAPFDKAEVFKPFKLALLNVILNGNDYVQIEKVAIAGMLPPAESHP